MHNPNQQSTKLYTAKAAYATPVIKDYGDARAITQTNGTPNSTPSSDFVPPFNGGPIVYYQS